MAILISGDFYCNAASELPLVAKSSLIQRYSQELYDEIRYHVVLGDGGFMRPGGEEREFINYWELSKRPFPVLCVMGNHDPALGRADLPESYIGIGEKVIVVRKENAFCGR